MPLIENYKGYLIFKESWSYGFTSKGRGTIKKGRIFVEKDDLLGMGEFLGYFGSLAQARKAVNSKIKEGK